MGMKDLKTGSLSHSFGEMGGQAATQLPPSNVSGCMKRITVLGRANMSLLGFQWTGWRLLNKKGSLEGQGVTFRSNTRKKGLNLFLQVSFAFATTAIAMSPD